MEVILDKSRSYTSYNLKKNMAQHQIMGVRPNSELPNMILLCRSKNREVREILIISILFNKHRKLFF